MTEREREHASLLPCPFCGFDLRAVDAIDVIYPTTRDGKVWGVHCADYAGGCDASMLGDNPADAAKNWNRRPAAALPADTVTVQEAWEWAGGNPGIKATRADLEAALRDLDAVCDEADAAPPAKSRGVVDVESALQRAYNLGQTYWQQADSEYTSDHRKASETAATFRQLVIDAVAALPAAPEESEYQRGFRDGYERRHMEVLGALV